MRRTFLDAERQREFERQGFTVVRLLERAAADSLRAHLITLESEAAPAPLRPGEALSKSFFHPDAAYRRRVDQLGRELCMAPLLAMLDGYRLIASGTFTKLPATQEMEIHRDWTLTRHPARPCVNAWCPLVDVDRDNGALAVLAGSHRLPNVETAGVASGYAAHSAALKRRSQTLPLRAGEAVLFDNRLLHWSAANRSREPRLALRAVTIPEEERHVFYRLETETQGRRFQLLDIEAEATLGATPAEIGAGLATFPSLGYVSNDNRPMSLRECGRLLKGDAPVTTERRGHLGEALRRLRAKLTLG